MFRPRPSNPFDFSQEDHDQLRDIHREIEEGLRDEPLDLDPQLASPEELARVEFFFPPAPAALNVTVYSQVTPARKALDASDTWTLHTFKKAK